MFFSIFDEIEFSYIYGRQREESTKSQSSSSTTSKPTEVAAKSIPSLPISSKKREIIDLTGTESLTDWLNFSQQQEPISNLLASATTHSNLPPPDLAREIQENQRKLDQIQKQANELQELLDLEDRINKLKIEMEETQSKINEFNSTTTMSDIDSAVSDSSSSSSGVISPQEMRDESISPSSSIGTSPVTILEGYYSIDEEILEEINKTIKDPCVRNFFINKIKDPCKKNSVLCLEEGIGYHRIFKPRKALVAKFPRLRAILYDNN